MPIAIVNNANTIRLVRQELAAWKEAAARLRRHGRHRDADWLERHTAEYEGWLLASVPV